MTNEMKTLKTKIARKATSKIEFIRQYLEVYSNMQAKKNRLNARQLDMMAYILAQPVHINQFKGMHAVRMAKHLELTANTVNTYKRQLRHDKGWLGTDGLPKKPLVSMQKAIHTLLDKADKGEAVKVEVTIPIVYVNEKD